METVDDSLGCLGFYKCLWYFPFVTKDHSAYFIEKWNDQVSLLWYDSHFISTDKTTESKGEEMHVFGLFPFSYIYRKIYYYLGSACEWRNLTKCFVICKGNGLLMHNLNKTRLACWRLISHFLKSVNSWDTTMTGFHGKVLRFAFSAEDPL